MTKKQQDYIRYLNDDKIKDFFVVPVLSKLLKIIKDDNEQRFQLEVRQNYVTVYYNGGKLTNIKKGLNGVYATDFDLNYCKNQGADSVHIQEIKAIGNRDMERFVDNLDIYIAEMDAWFAKHPKAERANQQIICKKFRRPNEIFNLLDIEFVLESARFDMLGADNNGNIKLIELKVGNKALSSSPKSGSSKLNSGVYKHYLDFLHIAQTENLVKAVAASAENIVKVRKALNLPTFDGKLNLDLKSIRFEIWLADYSAKGTILAREAKKIEENGGCADIIKINPPFLSEIKKTCK